MESETVLASMATFLSWRPDTLGNSDMESFFDEYMPCVVAHERSCGPPMLHRKQGRARKRGQVNHSGGGGSTGLGDGKDPLRLLARPPVYQRIAKITPGALGLLIREYSSSRQLGE